MNDSHLELFAVQECLADADHTGSPESEVWTTSEKLHSSEEEAEQEAATLAFERLDSPLAQDSECELRIVAIPVRVVRRWKENPRRGE